MLNREGHALLHRLLVHLGVIGRVDGVLVEGEGEAVAFRAILFIAECV